jgi:drug/metabolite transporter superfamily protein YnfA
MEQAPASHMIARAFSRFSTSASRSDVARAPFVRLVLNQIAERVPSDIVGRMKSVLTSRMGSGIMLVCAALLEVGGDALIRKGLRGSGMLFATLGVIVLGSYGIVVNLLDIDFSRVLGAYVGVFAVVSVFAGRLLFRDHAPASTWVGLGIVLIGSLVIQGAYVSR